MTQVLPSPDEPTVETAAEPVRRLPRWLSVDHLVLVGVFAVSRMLYGWFAHVEFDASGLMYSSQLLDTNVLRDRLVESVWYLHSQPPLFNLGVGAVLRWSPVGPIASFHAVFVIFGLALMFGLYDLARSLRTGRWAALVVAIVISCSPTTVLYENWLSYEYPVATLLVLFVAAGVRWARTGGQAAFGIAVVLAVTATLTRSLVHPIWLVLMIVLLVAARRPKRSWTTAVCLLPLLLVVGVIGKNTVLFDTPQLTSWFGFNLHRIAINSLPDNQREQLAAEGIVTGAPDPPCTSAHPEVPVLAVEYKEGLGPDTPIPSPNYNLECLIPRHKVLQTEAIGAIRAHPRWYARNVAGATEIWASPSSLNPFVYNNRLRVSTADDVFRRVVLADVAWEPPVAIPGAWPVLISAPDKQFHLSLTLVGATVLSILAAAWAAVKWRRRTPARFGVLIGGVTVLFVTLGANLFEYGENNRIRFIAEPLTLVLAFAIAVAGVRWAVARFRARQPSPDTSAQVTAAVVGPDPDDAALSSSRVDPVSTGVPNETRG